MNRLIIYATVFVVSLFSKIYGQETFEHRANKIANQIEKITKEEKAILKIELDKMEEELNSGKISKSEYDSKKSKAAQDAASRIETRVAVEESKLTQLVKEKVEGRIAVLDTTEKKSKDFFKIIIREAKRKDSANYIEKRTTSQLVFASGVNNVVTNSSVANSDFRYWGSHFYEIGITFNTRLAKNNNLLHLKYGLSWQINNLRATDNRVFVENGDQTKLETSTIQLDESRFRNMNIVAPIYLEFDFGKNKNNFFKIQKGFRLGLGGYFGANIESKQILEYTDQFGNCVVNKTTGGFNVNDLVYGLGGYIGHKNTSLYVKCDLNPLFKSNEFDQRNISLGLRFDFN